MCDKNVFHLGPFLKKTKQQSKYYSWTNNQISRDTVVPSVPESIYFTNILCIYECSNKFTFPCDMLL